MATKIAPKIGINDLKVKKLVPGSITNKTPINLRIFSQLAGLPMNKVKIVLIYVPVNGVDK